MTRPARTWPRFSIVTAAVFGVVCFCFFAFFLFAHPAIAQTTALQQFGEVSILPKTNLITVIARLIRAFLGILGIIFVILVIYAGYLYMTSGGDPAKTSKAKKMIYQATIGLLIILSSYTITSFILNALLGTQNAQIVSTPPIEKYVEPLAGSLGAGIIESHYPPRDALDIPRNTKIFVTFKEPIDPADFIQGFNKDLVDGDPAQQAMLNTTNVWIFESAKGKDKKLAADKVKVSTLRGPLDPTGNLGPKAYTTFVFDPVDLLGSPTEDTNYTVALQPDIKKADGKNAFVGVYSSGYGWTFEVSTEVDLTPPKVTDVVPTKNTSQPRNVTVEMVFNEAMDPISSTGTYNDGSGFTNISIKQNVDGTSINVDGTFEMSNGYRTVGFTSDEPCGKDPCGNTIFCLPGSQAISVIGRAASVDAANVPQAQLIGVTYNGLTDAAGNSLDGSGDGIACGPEDHSTVCPNNAQNDNYEWAFNTTANLDTTVPKVVSLSPSLNAQEISQSAPLQMSFNIPLKSSTVNSANVSVWPDPLYKDKNQNPTALWFYSHAGATTSTIEIEHQSFVSSASDGWDYYPVLTHGLKGNNQICMYPAQIDPGATDQNLLGKNCDGTNDKTPYCCNGVAGGEACKTTEAGKPLPGNE